jgi:serine/threonine protein kinase, bacterial
MPLPLSPGLVLNDRYLVRHVLGQGGFGRTYLAEDSHRFNEPCVLKEFAPQLHQPDLLRKARELFEREAGFIPVAACPNTGVSCPVDSLD